MTVDQAVKFAFDTIKEVKVKMILSGNVTPELVFAACNKLAAILKMEVATVIEIFEIS